MYEPLSAPLCDYATADQDVLADLDGTTYHKLELVIKRAGGQYAGIYCQLKDWDQTAAGQLARARYIIEQQQQALALLAARAERFERDAECLPALAETAVATSAECNRLRLENDGLRVALAELQAETKRLSTQLAIKETVIEHRAMVLTISSSSESSLYPAGELDAIRDALEIAENETMDRAQPEPEPMSPSIPCRYGCGRTFDKKAGRGAHEKKVHGAVWQGEPLPVASGPWRCAECHSDTFAASVSQPELCIRCAQSSNGVYIKLTGIAA